MYKIRNFGIKSSFLIPTLQLVYFSKCESSPLYTSSIKGIILFYKKLISHFHTPACLFSLVKVRNILLIEETILFTLKPFFDNNQ